MPQRYEIFSAHDAMYVYWPHRSQCSIPNLLAPPTAQIHLLQQKKNSSYYTNLPFMVKTITSHSIYPHLMAPSRLLWHKFAFQITYSPTIAKICLPRYNTLLLQLIYAFHDTNSSFIVIIVTFQALIRLLWQTCSPYIVNKFIFYGKSSSSMTHICLPELILAFYRTNSPFMAHLVLKCPKLNKSTTTLITTKHESILASIALRTVGSRKFSILTYQYISRITIRFQIFPKMAGTKSL